MDFTQSNSYKGTVKDFDWQLNLSLSSDKLSSLNQAMVNLDFEFEDKKKLTNLEMNKLELDKFVNALESIDEALQSSK